MHALAAFVLASSTTTTAAKTSAASSAASLIFILVIGLAAYFLFLRPRSQAARRQRDTLLEIGVGDEVLTGAGIFGTVLDVEPDRVTIETAPGTRLTVLRSTIARRITSETVSDDEHGWEEGHDQGSWDQHEPSADEREEDGHEHDEGEHS